MNCCVLKILRKPECGPEPHALLIIIDAANACRGACGRKCAIRKLAHRFECTGSHLSGAHWQTLGHPGQKEICEPALVRDQTASSRF